MCDGYQPNHAINDNLNHLCGMRDCNRTVRTPTSSDYAESAATGRICTAQLLINAIISFLGSFLDSPTYLNPPHTFTGGCLAFPLSIIPYQTRFVSNPYRSRTDMRNMHTSHRGYHPPNPQIATRPENEHIHMHAIARSGMGAYAFLMALALACARQAFCSIGTVLPRACPLLS